MHRAVEVNATSKYHLSYIVSEKEQPPPEIHGDVFDRQRVMKNFDQCSVEQQRVFVLGVGGIGSSIAMCLVRSGVDTVHLLDRDVVEASNLNRQILFSLSDIGRSKVEAAAQHLKHLHNLRTTICEYHTDAVMNWSCVVEIAKKCTFVFNNIDYGSVFDYAVNSLCKSLGILYIAGSTYAKSLIEECLNELELQLPSASQLSTLFLPLYQKKVLELLLPQSIQKHQSIESIPKDRSFPTRTVGSWIGVCVSGACLIVNTWIQYIMKTRNSNSDVDKSFHNWSQFNLSMFGGGYYTATFPNEQDLKCCPIFSKAIQRAEQNSSSVEK